MSDRGHDEIRSVGVVGLGQMGRGIAASLDKTGMLAAVWDVAPAARERLFSSGVVVAGGREMSKRCDTILFVVPISEQIAANLDGPDGILSIDKPGQVLIDLTTSDPEHTRSIATKAAAHGRIYLDAGMTGGAAGADAGTLTLMMGGDAAALAQVRPALDAIAKRVFHVGPSGAGHTLKLIHNMVVHTNFLAACEACRMAEGAGLDLAAVIDVFNAGNARSFITEQRFPNHILSGRFDGRSTVSNLAKDLGMAAAHADARGDAAPYTHLTAQLLQRAVDAGMSADDFTTLYPRLDELTKR